MMHGCVFQALGWRLIGDIIDQPQATWLAEAIVRMLWTPHAGAHELLWVIRLRMFLYLNTASFISYSVKTSHMR